MLFVSPEDFYTKAALCKPLSRAEEKSLAERMKSGDAEARQALIEGYLPMVASVCKHQKPQYQSLELIYRCLSALEQAVDRFDFLQDSETFTHHLSWVLRQTTTRYMVDR